MVNYYSAYAIIHLMNSGSEPRGFTIIEVLIVIAISSFLLVAAILALTSDQNQTEFDTGARQIFSQLQSLSSDVQNGKYASNPQYSCVSTSGSPSFTSPPASEGTNFGCIYVGKAMQFNPSLNSSYYVYSLVGDQFGANLSPPSAFPSSATVLDSVPTPSSYPPAGVQIFNLPDQFAVSKITYAGNPSGNNNDIVGFYNVQAASLSSNSSLNNQVFIIPESAGAVSSQQAVSDINGDSLGTGRGQYNINLTSPVTVCFTSPLEPNEFAQISFNNQTNSTNLTLNYNYTSC
jgi:prepilin-type N-terminal cleavage/methylation domain-containing protein